MKKLIKNTLVIFSFFLSLCVCAINAYADDDGSQINTFTINKYVGEAILRNPFGNFVNYKIEGMCFWLHHGFLGIPYITTTAKVNEFIPDAIVSVYNHNKSNPWLFGNDAIDPVMKTAGDAINKAAEHEKPEHNTFSVGSSKNMMQKYKEVDVVGDPGLVIFFTSIGFASMNTEATIYRPYYSSLADTYNWRTPLLEILLHPQYLIPGVRTEGSLIDQWGSIFPRTGYINQLGDYKAAAVIALRGADLATDGMSGHVSFPKLHSGSCTYEGHNGSDCHVSASHENDYNNVKYQEIYPKPTAVAKKDFGVNDLFNATTYKQDQFSKGKGNYVWVMWRHYKGCIQDSGKFIAGVP